MMSVMDQCKNDNTLIMTYHINDRKKENDCENC